MNGIDHVAAVELTNQSVGTLKGIAQAIAFEINHQKDVGHTPTLRCLKCDAITGIILQVLVERLLPVLASAAACTQGLRVTGFENAQKLADAYQGALYIAGLDKR